MSTAVLVNTMTAVAASLGSAMALLSALPSTAYMSIAGQMAEDAGAVSDSIGGTAEQKGQLGQYAIEANYGAFVTLMNTVMADRPSGATLDLKSAAKVERVRRNYQRGPAVRDARRTICEWLWGLTTSYNRRLSH